MSQLVKLIRSREQWLMLRKRQTARALEKLPPQHRPHTFKDMVVFAADLKDRAAQPGNFAAEFEASYLALIEDGFSVIPDADFKALRASSIQRDDGHGHAVVAYIDGLLAARPHNRLGCDVASFTFGT